MKVVLFCGGLGMRMRDGVAAGPKPMVMIGDRPLLWHVMRYYAHYGHNEFVLCLGYGAGAVKDYFLRYDETASNDFVLSAAGRDVELLSSDIADWRITFVDTGVNATIGERLLRVRAHLGSDEMFLANYADILTDAPLPHVIERFRRSDAAASLLAVPPQASFHVVHMSGDDRVTGVQSVHSMPLWENGGYFVLRPEIFDHLPPGGDLIMDACRPLAQRGRLLAHRHRGFWQPADTVKERHALEAAYHAGDRPWMLWERADEVDLVEPDRDPLQDALAAMQGSLVER